MEDDRVSVLETQLAQAKLIAEEADKKYEEVTKSDVIIIMTVMSESVSTVQRHILHTYIDFNVSLHLIDTRPSILTIGFFSPRSSCCYIFYYNFLQSPPSHRNEMDNSLFNLIFFFLFLYMYTGKSYSYFSYLPLCTCPLYTFIMSVLDSFLLDEDITTEKKC